MGCKELLDRIGMTISLRRGEAPGKHRPRLDTGIYAAREFMQELYQLKRVNLRYNII